ncbi:MAG: MoaD/ThiS family protein [Nocardioidaceae bacterium]|nr:MoaD/ThiS family protein [Nocardioidaceae bacterium]
MHDNITVRYWAAARSAAGIADEEISTNAPLSLSALCAEVSRRHPDTRLPEVLKICSFLIGDRPVGTSDPESVMIEPGQTVEFLPPFAGGQGPLMPAFI